MSHCLWNIWYAHMKCSILNSAYDMWHIIRGIWYAAYDMRYMKCGIWNAAYEMRHMICGILNSAYDMRHIKFGISYAAHEMRHMKCGIWNTVYDMRHMKCCISYIRMAIAMLVKFLRCWRVLNVNRLPTSRSCHQQKLSPTSVTNIDVNCWK